MEHEQRHIFAIPTGADFTDRARALGFASSLDEALAIVKSAGYIILPEGEGGNYDVYDAQDAPKVYGFDHDGLGAFGITVAL